MKKQNAHKHPAVLLMLIMLGMSVLVYQTAHSYVQHSIITNAKVSDSSKSEKSDSQEITVAVQDVFLSATTIQLDQAFHQIKEIVFGDSKKEKHTHVITKYASSFFRTLFEQVISPNAP